MMPLHRRRGLLLSFLLAALVTYVVYLLTKRFDLESGLALLVLKKGDSLLTNVIALLAALLGFTISTVAIMATFLDRRKFRPLVASGKAQELIAVFRLFIYNSVFGICACFAGVFLWEKFLFWMSFVLCTSMLSWGLYLTYCLAVFFEALKAAYRA
jgi:hypothetical protein